MSLLLMFQGVALVLVIYLIFYLVMVKTKILEETVSPYECGFNSISGTRVMFSHRFFLISLMFLIFDVEISVILPVPFLVKSMWGGLFFFFFFFVLLSGLLYEYKYGALEWVEF